MADRPIRVQQHRVKGWQKPPNTVSVTRGPRRKWGNPFKRPEDPAFAVLQFSFWVDGLEHFPNYPRPPTRDEIRAALRGKNLMCFCPLDQPCHADVLLEIANAPITTEKDR